jgi:hypothetical protein
MAVEGHVRTVTSLERSHFILIASPSWMRPARTVDRKRSIPFWSAVAALAISGSHRENLARHHPNELHLGLVVGVVHGGTETSASDPHLRN